MGPSRRARLATTTSVAALVVAAMVAWGASGGGGRASGHQSAPSRSVPTTAPASGRATSGTGPAEGTSTTVPATDRVFPVTETQLTVAAHDDAGAPVSVPTAVWVPAGRAGGRFPLVVFSPGYQIAPSEYEPLLRDWASAGYVVAEPTYPDTAPGSPEVESDMVNHPAELRQVITALTSPGTVLASAVDASEIALAGQSDGGDVSLAAAAGSCCRIPGIGAVLILSGAEATLFGGTYFSAGNPPLLAIQGDLDTINPPGCSQQLYDGATAPRYYLDLPGATHLSAYTAEGPQLDAVSSASLDFLDGYLKGMTTRLTQLVSDSVPGVSRLISASPVPVTGGCPGAPPGG